MTGKADYDATDPDFHNYVMFQALPALLSEHATAGGRGGNVLGLERVPPALQDGDQEPSAAAAVVFQMQHMVRTAGEEAVARERLAAMYKTLRAQSQAQGLAVDWAYLGYADGFLQDPLGSYGPENVRFIRDVAARYDPEGVFQTRVPGGFKISNVA